MSKAKSVLSGDSTGTGPDVTLNIAEHKAKVERMNAEQGKVQAEQQGHVEQGQRQFAAPVCEQAVDMTKYVEEWAQEHWSRCNDWVAGLPDSEELVEEPFDEPMDQELEAMEDEPRVDK